MTPEHCTENVIARIKGFRTRYIPGEDVKIVLTRYMQSGNALLIEADKGFGELIAKVSVNMPDLRLAEDEVLIKSYSENEGILEALISAGVIEDTGVRVPSGLVSMRVCKILALTATTEKGG